MDDGTVKASKSSSHRAVGRSESALINDARGERASSSSSDNATQQEPDSVRSRIREASPKPSGMQVGKYQLGDCLGKGAFGTVYRGLNIMSGETVAVKQIRLGDTPSSELGEIMAEIDLLKNLRHANIVKYKGSEKTREHLFVILEYCENGSLQHICKRFGKFPEGLVGVYISQVLEGLMYLHDQGVIHRDIKGANILTNKDGTVKLADFGVATKAGSLLNDNAVVGSPYWMAPEVIDQSGATTASDIWSVGCVIIELLEGKPPYANLEPMPALFRIVQDDCPPLPEGASPMVKDFLTHCFQKDANLRVSARKLARHPWILASRKQLQQMQNGGSIRGLTTHAEAVKSVQDWNEALKEPVKVASSKGLHFTAATVRRLHTNARDDSATADKATKPTARDIFKGSPSRKAEDDCLPSHARREKKVRPTLVSVLLERERRMEQLGTEREDCPSWDDEESGEFENFEVEGGDGGVTIKARPSSGGQIAARRAIRSQHVDDYSDLVDDEEAGGLAAKIAGMRQRATSNDGALVKADTDAPHPGKGINSKDSLFVKSEASLDEYAEREEEGDFSDLITDAEEEDALKLRPRAVAASNTEVEVADDPFGELEEDEQTIAEGLDANVARDRHARLCAHVVDLFSRLSEIASEDEVVAICDELEIILTDQPEMKSQALAAHGALIVVQLLEAIQIRDISSRLLGLLNVIIFEDPQAQENLCLVGAIPVVMPFCSKKYPHEVRIEAAHFIFSMCSSSALTLQFVLSCRGLKTLVGLIDEDYMEQRDLVWLGVACVNSVLELQSRASRNDFCRMLATDGLLEPLSTALLSVLADDEEVEYASSARDHILHTLLIFASSEPWLKEQLARRHVMRRLLQACETLKSSSLITMLKCFKSLTMNPSILDELENCNMIEVLARILEKERNGPIGNESANQILNAMYNLCRLNRRRQEEAAQAGIIPQLVRVVKSQSPLKQFALPILCEMAHAGKSTRKLLNQQCGIEFFLRLLRDPNWQLQSLEAILIWLQEDFARIETVLLRMSSVQALEHVFVESKTVYLETYLESFLKIFKLSSGTALALGDQVQFVNRLMHHLQTNNKAIVRLNLLRILKTVCDVYPETSRFERQHNLIEILDNLANRDAAVLVRELAREITTQLREPHRDMSLAAKDAQRTVRRAASETLGVPDASHSSRFMRPSSPQKPMGKLARAASHRSALRPLQIDANKRSTSGKASSSAVTRPVAGTQPAQGPVPRSMRRDVEHIDGSS